MAAEAEASREARAKVIAADGEMRASKALREASNVIEQSPAALQLRYLQVGQRWFREITEIFLILQKLTRNDLDIWEGGWRVG